ncbi:hypothetical protein M3Y98_01003200 [Aphelenchoides besseyi]|nr:hypothetical protein M3Y98_01003200 [Aphelenchoides besseyi]KAI6195175.1 hypothetical protein M3Y96_01203000 [Aphelenchoides besseyi]
MFRWLLFTLTVRCYVSGDSTAKVFTIVRDHFGRFELEIGSPPQKFKTAINFRFAHLIVTDEDCVEISDLYCNPLCSPFLNVMRDYCPKQKYSRSNSSTYLEALGYWMQRLDQSPRPLFGVFVLDELIARGYVHEHSPFPAGKVQFVSGLFLDSWDRFSCFAPTSFGLAPSDSSNRPSIVMQTYKAGLLEKPIASLSIGKNNGYLNLGGYDEENCTEWTHYAKTNYTGWILEVDEIKFFGLTFSGPNYITIENQEIITIPHNALERILNSGALIRSDYPHHYYGKCNYDMRGTFEFNFIIDNKEWVLSIDAIPYNETICEIEILASENLYEDEPWILNLFSWAHVCMSFDYETKMIGLAKSIYL